MKIIHVLADGTVKEDITGFKIKPESAGEFYDVLIKIGAEKKKHKEALL